MIDNLATVMALLMVASVAAVAAAFAAPTSGASRSQPNRRATSSDPSGHPMPDVERLRYRFS